MVGGFARRVKGPLLAVGNVMKNFFSRILRIIRNLVLAATAILVGGLVMAFRRLDREIKQSRVLSIGVDQLRQFRAAAEEAGVAPDSLNKGLKKMAKAITDGAAGMTTYTRAFDTLKLDAKELAKLDTAEAFRQIADATKRAVPNAARLSAIMDIFGARASDLMGLLRQGRTPLEQMAQEFAEFGINISDLGVENVEALNDQVSKLGRVFKGIFDVLALKLAPKLLAIIKAFTDWAKEVKFVEGAADALWQMLKGIGTFVLTFLKNIELAALQIQRTLLDLRATMQSLSSGHEGGFGPFARFNMNAAPSKELMDTEEQLARIQGRITELSSGKKTAFQKVLERIFGATALPAGRSRTPSGPALALASPGAGKVGSVSALEAGTTAAARARAAARIEEKNNELQRGQLNIQKQIADDVAGLGNGAAAPNVADF